MIRIHMKEVVQDAEENMSPMQIVTLRILVHEGELSQASLVKLLQRDKSQVTRLVHELERKGLIIKTRDPNDGRSFLLRAIEEVREKVGLFDRFEDRLVKKMLKGISKKEVETLGTLLLKMQNNLK